MTSDEGLALLPPDPTRGLDAAAVAAEEGDFSGGFYSYGMCTPAGGARVSAVVASVSEVLAAGLGREAALQALLGGFARLERDGHSECSDTVVRESVRADLEPACAAAGVEPFTDDEIGEVALLLSLRSIDAMRRLVSQQATSGAPG